MRLRSRIILFSIELFVILVGSWLITGSWISVESWFGALVALAINFFLLEPWFSRPVDTLANSIVSLILVAVADKSYSAYGWNIFTVFLIVGVVISLLAILLNQYPNAKLHGTSQLFSKLCRIFTAGKYYTGIYFLALIGLHQPIEIEFWYLTSLWLIVVTIPLLPFQDFLKTHGVDKYDLAIENSVSPNKILLNAQTLPALGRVISLTANGVEWDGVITGRIVRPKNIWGEISLFNAEDLEKATQSSPIIIDKNEEIHQNILGSVDVGSTQDVIVFSPLMPIRIGDVVFVNTPDGEVFYQVARGEIADKKVQGGGRIFEKAVAVQLGIFNSENQRISIRGWTPPPGEFVRKPNVDVPNISDDNWVNKRKLGAIIGTNIPVYLIKRNLLEGHLAMLGMTRMGKTTLTRKIANFYSTMASVIIFDQTGEYISKFGLTPYDPAVHISKPGVSVFEPAPATVVPDEGLNQFKDILNTALLEYRAGKQFRRVIIIDEAHQFVPEPTMLGFNMPGRESSITFGMYMMQVRKYGISVVLISQRTAVVAKSALSQCENIIAFKSVDKTGLDYLNSILGPESASVLPILAQGQALVSGPAFSSDHAVAVDVIE
ncbi:MAG: DUF87 domain-containing protein [Candidatus Marinimicrobia bacterium]|nr:DUF87 domain-containing protein [Candidatus Neomarinimicrobiota bacterium]MCF7903933.1 DUF87 domain-containing protein [Candidatus Neomarinimicrobiota bacterium]